MKARMTRIRAKVVGATMAAILAVSPLAVISMSMVTGCGGGGCLPAIPCGCTLQFGAGLLAIWLLRNNGLGADGISCWDLNGNGDCDLATEDANTDGVCNALDCQGLPGEPGQSIPGIDGLNCWDLNADGVADPDEDINDDGVWNAYDCRGTAGPPGSDGSDGQDGSDGSDGPPGPAGPTLFDLFIEDFFTYGQITNSVSGQGEVINIQEPLLSSEYRSYGPIGFRVSVPEIYTEGNPVTLRLFLWREYGESAACTTLQFDVFRLIPSGGIERYGANPVWLRLEPGSMTNPGMLVVDLPLNTAPDGLGFPNDLYAPQMLAFEISVFRGVESVDLDAELTVLGAEVFESVNAADTGLSGVTVFTSADGVYSFCEWGSGGDF